MVRDPALTTRASFVVRLQSVVPWIGAVVAAICAATLVGWAVDSAMLKSVVPGTITMKVNTALGLMLLAVALLALHRTTLLTRAAIPLCLTLVSALSLATLAEYAFGIDLKIDNFLFQDHASPRFPGRNAPATNGAFLGLVAVFAFLHTRRGRAADALRPDRSPASARISTLARSALR